MIETVLSNFYYYLYKIVHSYICIKNKSSVIYSIEILGGLRLCPVFIQICFNITDLNQNKMATKEQELNKG